MNLLLPLLGFSLAFLLLFAAAEGLYRWAKVPAEYTRKLVHICTGLLSLLFPIWLTRSWQVALLCGSFLVLLLRSLRVGALPSIHAVARKTAGSWLFAVVVVVVYFFYDVMRHQVALHFYSLYYYYLPLLILAFCDPLAALAGSRRKARQGSSSSGKTLAGSAAFFASALIISLLLSLFFRAEGLGLLPVLALAGATALATTLAERFSGQGWDNFTIPCAAMATLALTEWLL